MLRRCVHGRTHAAIVAHLFVAHRRAEPDHAQYTRGHARAHARAVHGKVGRRVGGC